MPKPINEVLRDFVRFTGDGLPNEPVGSPLPIGDPSSGVHNPTKKDIREALGDAAAAAQQAQRAMLDAQGASLFAADVPSLLSNTAASYPAGTVFATRAEGFSYRVAASGATDHDAVTAGGVKLYRLRQKRIILAYSQSNFAGKATGTPWTIEPPPNLFVWNGGNWSGDMVPPLGDAFVPASSLAPQVPIAYAAELARSRPNEDWFLIIVARGGTSIRALAGLRFKWSSAVSGAPAAGSIRMSAARTELAYSETDIHGFTRFSGGAGVGSSGFYPARIQTTLGGGTSWIEFTPGETVTDDGDSRRQSITVTGQANWPPANDADVTLFPSEPRMRTVMTSVVSAALQATRLPAAQRKIDKLFIWPTEGDMSWPEGYAAIDYPFLMSFLSPWLKAETETLLTLPYAYSAATAVRNKWWDAIRGIAAEAPARRKIVSLKGSGVENWQDYDNIHVANASKEAIGYLIRRTESMGGDSNTVLSGAYLPTFTALENIGSLGGTLEARWLQVGEIVQVAGVVTISPSASGASTRVRISLPTPSDLASIHQLSGVMSNANQADNSGRILADTANDAAEAVFTSKATGGGTWAYQFSYQIR